VKFLTALLICGKLFQIAAPAWVQQFQFWIWRICSKLPIFIVNIITT